MTSTPRTSRGGGVLRSWLGLVVLRWPVGGAVFLAVAGLAAAILFLSHPVWRAEARLRLSEPPPSTGVSPVGGVLSFLRPGGDPFANDMEVLGSRTVADEVTAELALDAEVVAPRGWYRDSLFSRIESTRATTEGAYRLTWESESRVRVDRLAPGMAEGVVTGSSGEALRFGGLVVTALPRRPGGPASVEIRTEPFAEASESFRSGLDFERSRRDANVLDLAFDHADPGVSRGALDAALSRFESLRLGLYAREAGTTVDSLRTVAAETGAELANAEEALERLQRQTGLVAPDVQAETYVERWSEARSALENARTELTLVEAAIAEMEAAPTPQEGWSALVAHPRFLENPTVGALVESLTALEQERVALASRRSPESREYRVVEDQIGLLDGSLRSVARSYARSLRETVSEAAAQEDSLRSVLDGLPAAAIEVGRRQRDVRLLTEVLVLTEQRLRQEEVRQALAVANVQVVDPPELTARPVWPRKKLGAAVGLMLACGSAFLAMVMVERADGRVRRAADVRELTGAPVLAALVQRRGHVSVTAEDAAGLAAVASGDPPALVLCGIGSRGDATEVETALREAGVPVRVRSAGPVGSWMEARAVWEAGAPIVLVLRYGRTEGGAVARAVDRLAEVGGHVAGSVLLCRSAAEGGGIWS